MNNDSKKRKRINRPLIWARDGDSDNAVEHRACLLDNEDSGDETNDDDLVWIQWVSGRRIAHVPRRNISKSFFPSAARDALARAAAALVKEEDDYNYDTDDDTKAVVKQEDDHNYHTGDDTKPHSIPLPAVSGSVKEDLLCNQDRATAARVKNDEDYTCDTDDESKSRTLPLPVCSTQGQEEQHNARDGYIDHLRTVGFDIGPVDRELVDFLLECKLEWMKMTAKKIKEMMTSFRLGRMRVIGPKKSDILDTLVGHIMSEPLTEQKRELLEQINFHSDNEKYDTEEVAFRKYKESHWEEIRCARLAFLDSLDEDTRDYYTDPDISDNCAYTDAEDYWYYKCWVDENGGSCRRSRSNRIAKFDTLCKRGRIIDYIEDGDAREKLNLTVGETRWIDTFGNFRSWDDMGEEEANEFVWWIHGRGDDPRNGKFMCLPKKTFEFWSELYSCKTWGDVRAKYTRGFYQVCLEMYFLKDCNNPNSKEKERISKLDEKQFIDTKQFDLEDLDNFEYGKLDGKQFIDTEKYDLEDLDTFEYGGMFPPYVEHIQSASLQVHCYDLFKDYGGWDIWGDETLTFDVSDKNKILAAIEKNGGKTEYEPRFALLRSMC